MRLQQIHAARAQDHLQREEDSRLHEPAVTNSKKTFAQESHVSVMVSEAIEALAIQPNDLVLDATAGQGGYSYKILKDTDATVIAIDADAEAVEATMRRLEPFGERGIVIEGNFADSESILRKQGVKELSAAVFDLGWNAQQLASGRGFSFLHDEPLSMSYGKNPKSGFTAQEIVNGWNEKTLADVFYGYGEEQYARRIAKAIIERRETVGPIKTTLELSELVRDSVPAAYRHMRIHPATKTFQALRIAVNDELGVIEQGLAGVWKHLRVGGRIAVVTFHSIEDRVVKRFFVHLGTQDGKIITKKPMQPTKEEVTHNPRARSAKLRIIEKICKE